MLAIKNNIMAGNAARHLGKAYDRLAQSVERLASGLRINSAKDDAAGLAVRELIRADVAVLQQGARNAQDGISMLQTMEGAMGVIDDGLIRMKELAEQAATGSYSDAQRTIMNAEFAEMAAEIDRVAGATKFNEIAMLNSGSGSVSIHVGTTSTIDVGKVDMTKAGLGINTGVEVYEALFTPELAATSTGAFVTITGEPVSLTVMFDNNSATEDAISINLTVGSYTISQIEAALNAVSGALGYAPDGDNKSYDIATIVTNDDGTFSLKVASRDEADGVSIKVASSTTNATGDWNLGGTGDTATTNAAAAGVEINVDNYAAEQVTGGVNIATAAAAATALTTLTDAINLKDSARATFGYKMNRLESTISVLDIQAENLMSAQSRISDVDVATEMAALTRTQVLSQAGIAMLVQANTMPQMALTLLRG
ncbi:MAG: flagellin [Phycisphaerae bacterium]|nr:flagellin [Phycisphaerae bacterium]